MKRLFMCMLILFTSLLSITLSGPAEAGSSQAQAPTHPVQDVQSFARSVEEALAAKGAYVAIVARLGRDPKDLPQGVTYTHIAFWVLSDVTGNDGRLRRGYRVWNLYQNADDPSVSSLVQDSPTEFFIGVKQLRTQVIIPKPKVQTRILKVLTDGTFQRLHNPNYSLLANPDNNLYQNCTEHVLNAVMAALYQTDDINRIKANTAAYFTAQPINLTPLERTLSPLFIPGLTTKDHRGGIETATFGSIARFMSKYKLVGDIFHKAHTAGE